MSNPIYQQRKYTEWIGHHNSLSCTIIPGIWHHVNWPDTFINSLIFLRNNITSSFKHSRSLWSPVHIPTLNEDDWSQSQVFLEDCHDHLLHRQLYARSPQPVDPHFELDENPPTDVICLASSNQRPFYLKLQPVQHWAKQEHGIVQSQWPITFTLFDQPVPRIIKIKPCEFLQPQPNLYSWDTSFDHRHA